MSHDNFPPGVGDVPGDDLLELVPYEVKLSVVDIEILEAFVRFRGGHIKNLVGVIAGILKQIDESAN